MTNIRYFLCDFCAIWYFLKLLIKPLLFKNLKNINLQAYSKICKSLYVYLNYNNKIFYFFLTVNKNEWKERKFRWQKNKKSNIYLNKKVVKIDDIDVNKILVSKEDPYGTKNSFKYFIGYNDNDIVRSFYVRLPQLTGNIRKFEFNLTIYFRINNK